MTTPLLIFRFERKREVENEIQRLSNAEDEEERALARALYSICARWQSDQELHYRSGALSLQPTPRKAARRAR